MYWGFIFLKANTTINNRINIFYKLHCSVLLLWSGLSCVRLNSCWLRVWNHQWMSQAWGKFWWEGFPISEKSDIHLALEKVRFPPPPGRLPLSDPSFSTPAPAKGIKDGGFTPNQTAFENEPEEWPACIPKPHILLRQVLVLPFTITYLRVDTYTYFWANLYLPVVTTQAKPTLRRVWGEKNIPKGQSSVKQKNPGMETKYELHFSGPAPRLLLVPIRY